MKPSKFALDSRVPAIGNVIPTLERLPVEVAAFAAERCNFLPLGPIYHGGCIQATTSRGWMIAVCDEPSRDAEEVQSDWAHEIAHGWRQARGEARGGWSGAGWHAR